MASPVEVPTVVTMRAVRSGLVLLVVLGACAGEPPTPADAGAQVPGPAPSAVDAAAPPAASGPAAAPRAMPPSPSTAPGVRIWPDPRLTHWPAIVYEREERNVSFELPVKRAGVSGSAGWRGGKALPFVLPENTERISGLLPLPTETGQHTAEIQIEGVVTALRLRIVDIRQPWPIEALRDGFPVDAENQPVVLVDRRRDPGSELKWRVLAASLARPVGRPLLVGDPLAALGGDAWQGLDAEPRPALDERFPQHAVLAALAQLSDPLPRTVVWSPGNQVLHGGAWSAEEERLFGAIRSRFEAAGVLPRLVLLLPPTPLDAGLQEQARQRRELLQRSAGFLGWTVLDADRVAGNAAEANRVGEGVFTRYPHGAAQERLRRALADVL